MIPAEAIEAAARKLCTVAKFSALPTNLQNTYRRKARAALEAAAPHLMARHPILEAVEDVCCSYLGAERPELAGAAMDQIIRLVSVDSEPAK